jgi:hypothetical protein
MVAPVMQVASSDSKNATTAAISSGFAKRPNEVMDFTTASRSASASAGWT